MSEIIAPLEEGLRACKCIRCGCMAITLKAMGERLEDRDDEASVALRKSVAELQETLESPETDCFGCKKCYPAVAWNRFVERYPITL